MSNEYKSEIVKAESVSINEQSNEVIDNVIADWDSIRKQELYNKISSKTDLKDEDFTIFAKPRSGCSHCYGRGFVGFYASNSTRLPNEPTLCSCVTNRVALRGEMPDTKDRMSYKEFKDMLARARVVYNLKDSKNEQTSELGVNPSKENGKEGD